MYICIYIYIKGIGFRVQEKKIGGRGRWPQRPAARDGRSQFQPTLNSPRTQILGFPLKGVIGGYLGFRV